MALFSFCLFFTQFRSYDNTLENCLLLLLILLLLFPDIHVDISFRTEIDKQNMQTKEFFPH